MNFIKVILLLSLFMTTTAYTKNNSDNPCKADRKSLCSQCEKGDRSCVRSCMKENKDKISSECKEFRKSKRVARKAQSSSSSE